MSMVKKLIITEDGLGTIRKSLIQESYSDKVILVKKFLDGNFMRKNQLKMNDDGTIGNLGVFVQITNSIPTEMELKAEDVFDILQNKFTKILTDEKKRDRFLIRIIRDWYDNKISKEGCLSKYDF